MAKIFGAVHALALLLLVPLSSGAFWGDVEDGMVPGDNFTAIEPPAPTRRTFLRTIALGATVPIAYSIGGWFDSRSAADPRGRSSSSTAAPPEVSSRALPPRAPASRASHGRT